jgi:hypothetical protein
MRKPEPTHIGSLAGKEPNAEATSGRNQVVQSNVAKVLHDGHAACHPLFDLCPMMSVVGPTRTSRSSCHPTAIGRKADRS